MTDTPAPPEQTPENMETRLPYDAEFVKHVEEFSGKMLATLPEMQGVAIIPIWAHQPEDFPPGFLRLRAQNRLYARTFEAYEPAHGVCCRSAQRFYESNQSAR